MGDEGEVDLDVLSEVTKESGDEALKTMENTLWKLEATEPNLVSHNSAQVSICLQVLYFKILIHFF